MVEEPVEEEADKVDTQEHDEGGDWNEDDSLKDGFELLSPRWMEKVEQEAYERVTKAKRLAIMKTNHKFADKKKSIGDQMLVDMDSKATNDARTTTTCSTLKMQWGRKWVQC